jgi:signal transduction histidine kinase
MTDTVSDTRSRIWLGLTVTGSALGLLFLLFLDLYFSAFGGSVQGPLVDYAELFTVAVTALAWLVGPRLGPIGLPIVASVAAGASLAVSLAELAFNTASGGVWGLAEMAAILGLLLVVARRSNRWLLAPAVGVQVAALAAQPMRSGGGDQFVIVGLLCVLVAVAVGAAGAYLRVMDSSRRRQVQLVRAEQRAELARDLHDFVAHHVTGIVVQAQGARVIADHDPERVAAALAQIEKAGAEAMASMRRMVRVLRDAEGDPDAPVAPLAGVRDLSELITGFNSAGTITASLHVEGPVDDLPIEIGSSAYRVVMEALTNVRRHAHRATRVDVVLHRTADWLFVRVADDGHGTGPRGHSHGFGLIGLHERVAALGGRIQAGPGAGGGWVVDVALPVTKQLQG